MSRLMKSIFSITEITKKCSLFVLWILENSFPQKVKCFSSYQNQFPRKVKSMNIHFLTRSNERKTISLEGQIIFFSQKSISSKGQMIFHLTFGGKKIPLKVKFDLQRLDPIHDLGSRAGKTQRRLMARSGHME